VKNKKQDIKKPSDIFLSNIKEHGNNWSRPWSQLMTGKPINPTTNNLYQGGNIVMLAVEDKESDKWAGYGQWKNAGRQVKRGEESAKVLRVVKVKSKTQTDVNGDPKTFSSVAILSVFNETQLDDYVPPVNDGKGETFNNKKIDAFIKKTGAKISHGSKGAYYMPLTDSISLPVMENFKDLDGATAEQNYYGTLFHELSHWTGDSKRCDRKNDTDILDEHKYQRSDYAFEELVAELGACFLCAEFGLEKTPQPNHGKYLNVWMSRLENDDKLFNKAFELAIESTDYLKQLALDN
tara:strand:- start:120 stop:1001 length:882 start_codon:yes stop_codon:yes gene_type:complete